MTYKLIVSDFNAATLIPWFLDIPPGIRVWHSIDLGNLDRQWITPITEIGKPHWRACSMVDTQVIRDPKEVAVVVREEVQRFPVEIRISGNGLSSKLTDESSAHVNEALEDPERTEYATYTFDYENQEAVILDATRGPSPLTEMMAIGDAIGLP